MTTCRHKYCLKYPGISALFLIFLLHSICHADSRLLSTGGVTQIEGAAGSGIVPWAVISGYSSSKELGGSTSHTYVETDDYDLHVSSLSISYDNRIEFSIARQKLELNTLEDLIGIPGADLEQDIIGLKIRLFGDVIYTHYPQVSLGVQYKHNRKFEIPELVGAKKRSGTDFYLSATKLWLAGIFDYNLLTNIGIRATRANELGLLGFSSEGDSSYDIVFENSIAIFLNRNILFGFDYRQKPNNLEFAREDDWKDYFIAYIPNKHLALVAAYTDLGSVATLKGQTGWYASLELSF
tara:strand:+ start:94487 stop:95371 length:885 start_codon:yes stop_codon:yes gene_type:complete